MNDSLKAGLIKFLKKEVILGNGYIIDFDKLLDVPKFSNQGDFTLPCFSLAKPLRKSPNIISKEICESLENKLPEFVAKVSCVGPFVNFIFNFKREFSKILPRILSGDFMKIDISKGGRVMIEYPSPNTNKSLHVGHSRNMLLGSSLSNILEKGGYKVLRTNMNNDRGIAICKALLAYKLFGEGSTPESLGMKPDVFVSHFYVLFGQKNKKYQSLDLNKQAQEMLVLWESGDKEVLTLWKKLMGYVFEGYKTTYNNYKLKPFDREYFESEIYKEGKDIVLNALEKNLYGFEKGEDGAIFFDFKDEVYGKKYLLRGDGTTMYMTQDLYLASLKEKEFDFDKQIFIVGVEQKYHFEVLFQLLEKLGLCKAESNYHFAYGYVYDKNGNPFSSRNGTVILADELFNLIVLASKKNILSKKLTTNLPENELLRRSRIIGFAAMSFAFLKINPLSSIKFDLEKSLSFEGDSGPYVLYTYARIKSILRNADFDEGDICKDVDDLNFAEKEENLIRILSKYPLVLEESALKYKVSAIANYLILLSQAFNDFYQNVNILRGSDAKLRNSQLNLCFSVSIIIKDAISLYGIETLEEM